MGTCVDRTLMLMPLGGVVWYVGMHVNLRTCALAACVAQHHLTLLHNIIPSHITSVRESVGYASATCRLCLAKALHLAAIAMPSHDSRESPIVAVAMGCTSHYMTVVAALHPIRMARRPLASEHALLKQLPSPRAQSRAG